MLDISILLCKNISWALSFNTSDLVDSTEAMDSVMLRQQK